jgi:hypothetical protein
MILARIWAACIPAMLALAWSSGAAGRVAIVSRGQLQVYLLVSLPNARGYWAPALLTDSVGYNDPNLCSICGVDFYNVFKDGCPEAYAVSPGVT